MQRTIFAIDVDSLSNINASISVIPLYADFCLMEYSMIVGSCFSLFAAGASRLLVRDAELEFSEFPVK